jgi:type I restriction enzyme M protein
MDEVAVRAEHSRGPAGRFAAGVPRAARTAEETAGRQLQESIRGLLRSLEPNAYDGRVAFLDALAETASTSGVNLAAPVRKAIVAAMGKRDESAEICRSPDGSPEADPELRDYENVPLGESVADFFAPRFCLTSRTPGSPRTSVTPRTARSGRYVPPRPLEEIEADIRGVEQEILAMLGQVTAPVEASKAE